VRRVRHGDLNRVASIESRSDDTSPSLPTTRRESTPSHGGIEVPDPERRIQEPLKTKSLLMRIPTAGPQRCFTGKSRDVLL